MTFGPAWERGGNAKNILTQQLPPPNSDGTWGRLTAEKMQMVIPLPPSPHHAPGLFGEEGWDKTAFANTEVSPKILGRQGNEW